MTTEALLETLSNAWFRIGSYGVCFHNLETLSQSGEVWIVHRPQQPIIYVHLEGSKFKIEVTDRFS